MKKQLAIIISILVIFSSLIGCTKKNIDNKSSKKVVVVSVVPEKTFVKAVAGELVDVVTMIPPGNSPANYQPNPKQMVEFSKADIYFTIGVSTEETNILPKAQELNEDIKIISLTDKVGEKYEHRYFEDAHEEHEEHNEQGHEDHKHEGRDPHIWLSPKRVKVMIETIAEELSIIDEKNMETYKKNAEKYISELDKLDNEIKETLAKSEGKSFIIYHPSIGYFADDYGLNMIAIEAEGKEATARGMQKVIEEAKGKNINVVFYQAEIDSRQSKTIAEEINGKVEKVDPLAEDYINNLRKIANAFKSSVK